MRARIGVRRPGRGAGRWLLPGLLVLAAGTLGELARESGRDARAGCAARVDTQHAVPAPQWSPAVLRGHESARDVAPVRSPGDRRTPDARGSSPGTGAVACRLRDESGAAVDGAQVELLRGAVLLASRATDAQGNARFEHVAPGPCSLRVDATSLAAPLLPPSRTPCRVRRGSIAEVELTAATGAWVEGRVTLGEGEPLRGALVRLIATDPMRFAPPLEVRSDAAGRYELTEVPPGRYRGQLVPSRAADWGPPPPVELDVYPGAVHALDFRASPGAGSIAGRMTDESGEPVGGLRLSCHLQAEGGSGVSGGPGVVLGRATTGADGSFALEGLPVARVVLRLRLAGAPFGAAPRPRRMLLAGGPLSLDLTVARAGPGGAVAVDVGTRVVRAAP